MIEQTPIGYHHPWRILKVNPASLAATACTHSMMRIHDSPAPVPQLRIRSSNFGAPSDTPGPCVGLTIIRDIREPGGYSESVTRPSSSSLVRNVQWAVRALCTRVSQTAAYTSHIMLATNHCSLSNNGRYNGRYIQLQVTTWPAILIPNLGVPCCMTYQASKHRPAA